jgi:hypothetical protein
VEGLLWRLTPPAYLAAPSLDYERK